MTGTDSRFNDLPEPRAGLPPDTAGRDEHPTPRFEVETLVGEGREAILVHNGEFYRLRVTANNKLILTK